MKFRDIPQFPSANYHIDMSWSYLETWLESQKELNLELNPDFQRGHVWTEAQQIAYIEFMLRAKDASQSVSGRDVYFNHPGWMKDFKGNFVCIDGLQRITAVRRFMNSEIPAFGVLYKDYEDKLTMNPSFSVHIMGMESRAEILDWYIDFNSAGTQHTPEELDRVRDLHIKELDIGNEKAYTGP